MLAQKLAALKLPISLVLTSPPYPGVHALYHRWQLFGRREIDLPYRLLGLRDGRYESHYTMGSRKERENLTYFERVRSIYEQLRVAMDRKALVAQVVGFSDPKVHLQRYREAMYEAGYEEVGARRGRPAATRDVPNRKWYAVLAPKQNAAVEYVLLHRPRSRSRGKVVLKG